MSHHLVIDRAPGRQVIWQQPERPATPKHVQNAIHNLASVNDGDRCIRRRLWDQGSQYFPLRVCQVLWIGFSVIQLFFSVHELITRLFLFLYRLACPLLTHS